MFDRFLAIERERRVALPSRPADEQVLVDEGSSELGDLLGAGDGLNDVLHASLPRVVISCS